MSDDFVVPGQSVRAREGARGWGRVVHINGTAGWAAGPGFLPAIPLRRQPTPEELAWAVRVPVLDAVRCYHWCGHSRQRRPVDVRITGGCVLYELPCRRAVACRASPRTLDQMMKPVKAAQSADQYRAWHARDTQRLRYDLLPAGVVFVAETFHGPGPGAAW